VTSTEPFDVKLARRAAREYEKLPVAARTRLRKALEKLAAEAAKPGSRGGKTVKTIRGADDAFHRLRVGDYRVMFDIIGEDRVLLVLGIVHRRDLERWLRGR
jgi:mRNA interferase RelE/StbE